MSGCCRLPVVEGHVEGCTVVPGMYERGGERVTCAYRVDHLYVPGRKAVCRVCVAHQSAVLAEGDQRDPHL